MPDEHGSTRETEIKRGTQLETDLTHNSTSSIINLDKQHSPPNSGLKPSQQSILKLQRTFGNRWVLGSLASAKQAHGSTVTPSISAAGAEHIQRRRMPDDATLASEIPTDAAGFAAVRPGVVRMLTSAWQELSTAKKRVVRTAAAAMGLIYSTEAQLRTALDAATRAQLLSFAREVRSQDTSTTLGDPLLIDIGPRPSTLDTANIGTLVTNATRIFTAIASGSHDVSIGQVFGPTRITAAKAKYALAFAQMNRLHTTNQIVTDRSGYNDETGLGGLTNSDQISVASNVIDDPDNDESVVTFIHESMHAGNNDVGDEGYIDQPSFKVLPESVKLTNAAHFEVVPRRILVAAYAFTGETFTPAGSSGTSPALTPREEAIREASERFRAAWTTGLNLHTLFVRVFRTPSEWSGLDLSSEYGVSTGARFSTTLPFWSKVEMLTLHNRTVNPTGPAAARPVTEIDIALSEGVIRKLSQAMGLVPPTPAEAIRLERRATAAERRAGAASATAEADLLVKLVLRVHAGSITGDVARDARVVAQMALADAPGDFSEYLRVRPPSSFP